MRASIVRCLAALAPGAIGCGDNIVREEPLEATSGSQLKLVGYLYDDGTPQWRADELYDVALHTRCARRRWIDGVERCVPVAADAVYTDADCTTVVGRAAPLVPPKYFIGRDRIDGELVPARFYRAGTETDPVVEVYERRDGACEGPVFEPPGSTYYTIIEEIPGVVMVPLRTETIGAGRVGLRALVADDGLLAPIAFEDRELAVDCRPARGDAGSAACEPVTATTAAVFADPACTEPAVADTEPTPSVVRVDGVSGCPRYHAAGAPIAPPVYRRAGAACEQVPAIPGETWRALGERLALAPVERDLDPGEGRLGRMVVRTDGLYAVDGELVDSATRSACEPLQLAGAVHCVPTPTAPALVRYHAGCGLEVRVAEVPAQPCAPIAFALAATAAGYEVHAIGDPVADALYEFVGACRPYVPPPGVVVHALGPALPPGVFAGALPAEDR
jgi:hypothetical protein